MADPPVPYGPYPVPLETAVVSCWRCGGPSRRHAIRIKLSSRREAPVA